jgi:hypothetical protein
MTNHTEEEISISVHHWKSREIAKGFICLVRINESQRCLPLIWIISVAKWQTNPVLGRQMAR